MVHGKKAVMDMTDKRYQFMAADWEAIKHEIRLILIALAKMRLTICYSDLAAQIQTAYVHHRAPAFHAMLRELDDMNESADEPSLAVLVVRKQTGRCGAGFFKTAAVNGEDVSDPEAYWQAQFACVCDYWSDN
jgi:hypothetical protein